MPKLMMSKSPIVSFIIPTFNGERFLHKTLDSVLSDPRSDIEVVVINDGSTDDTSSILESFSDERLKVLMQRNLGISNARNKGLHVATGKYLVFLDHDDIYEIKHLDRMLEPFSANPRLVLTYANSRRIDKEGFLIPGFHFLSRFVHKPSGNVLKSVLSNSFIRSLGVCCIRSDGVNTPRFNEKLRMSEDWEYIARLACKGEFQYIKHITILRYRIHGANISMEYDEKGLDSIAHFVFKNPEVMGKFSKKTLSTIQSRRKAHSYMILCEKQCRAMKLNKSIRYLQCAIAVDPLRIPFYVLWFLNRLFSASSVFFRKQRTRTTFTAGGPAQKG